MKKSLFILVVITLISLIVIALLIHNRQMSLNIADKKNQEYESYTVNSILGSSLMTLINKVTDSNEQNGVQKNNKGFYIANDENSIIIEIKFAEREERYRMEQISRLGSEEFVRFYNTMSFKCTRKLYHENTKNISYMYFEQV